jgi:hypothetical protein
MNWNPTQPPKSDMAARFARTRRLERRMPSRTSGSAARRSCQTKNAKIAAAPANDPSVRAESQPACGASTSVYTSSSIAPVIETAPVRSNARRRWMTPTGSGTSFTAPARAAAATTVGRKNTQRQPTSVSRPPNTSPSENPVAPVAV